MRNFLQANGWPDADRLTLSGRYDRGDVVVCRAPLTIVEVKAGAQAEAASPGLIADWMAETDTERRNATAVIGALVVRRFRRNVAAWDVWLPLNHLVWLDTGAYGGSTIPVRMSLADFSDLLHTAAGRWT